MKIRTLFLFSLVATMISCNTTVNKTDSELTDSFVIKRGLNTSHWLSQSFKHGDELENYMQARDFEAITKAGFDHVRIPIDEEYMWNEQGVKNDTSFSLLHGAIKNAFDNNLRVIIDLHIIRAHSFDKKENLLWTDISEQEKFWDLWEQLSEELHKYSTSMLAYELLNESVAPSAQDLNTLIDKAIKAIRKNEPTRVIVIGSNEWQKVYTFKDLIIPEGDTNLILSFHFYEPLLLTHHTAEWSGVIHEYKGEVHYPGYTIDTLEYANLSDSLVTGIKIENGYFDRSVLEEKIMLAVKVAKEHNLPLYCGEFGCLPTTSIELRQALYSDLIDIFNQHNIAWSHWNYKNDFPLFDAETLEPDEDLLPIFMK